MTNMRSLLIGGALALLAACVGPEPVRGPAIDHAALASGAITLVAPDYKVTAIRVTVPHTLVVSEDNSYHPDSDIVWHGDPYGDRYAQIQTIFEDAFRAGTADLQGSRKVILDAEVTRFHALTQRTRYTVGGVHSLRFILTVRDAKTGAILDGPRLVTADVAGSGGARAVQEEAEGLTQKVVIENRLADVIRAELTAPLPVAAVK